MKNYALHYSYKNIGDVILVIFDNAKSATRSERKDKVTAIYHDDEIIGYNIFDVKEIVKIKNEGMIFLPSEGLISVINSILTNEGFESLELKENSGYFTAEVADAIELDDNKLFVTAFLGNECVNGIIKNASLQTGDKIVVATVGTYLSNGEVVKMGNMDGTLLNAHICTNKDLGIKEDEDKVLLLDKDIEIGKDFFSMEVK